MKHKPTTPENREAALRFQAEQLLKDAEAWGYLVNVTHASTGHVIHVEPRLGPAGPGQ